MLRVNFPFEHDGDCILADKFIILRINNISTRWRFLYIIGQGYFKIRFPV